ncbi:MAG: ABC transporter permease [Geminicoccaceae bacterium]
MLAYMIQRVLILIPMLLVISFLVYLGLELTPGDAVSHMINPDLVGRISPEKLDELRETLGLNKTFIERYSIWLFNALQGNFGYSLSGGVAISEIFLDRLPATLELSIAALLISTLFGCVLGTFSALNKGSLGDSSLTVVGMFGVSIPEFFFGLVAILIFALHLSWLPVGGRLMPGYETFWDRLPHLVLPALVLSLMMTAGVMRYSRSSMLDSLGKEFIVTARSKGLPEWRINFLHGFRVALTPVIVLIGFRLPTLIGGSVIIEEVFQWPGVGKEFVAAVRGADYPLVMMIALFSVFAMLIASLIVDFLTALIDPRVRLGEG